MRAAPGDIISTLDAPPSVHAFDNTTQGNVSNTTPAAGSPDVGVTFTAPTSGYVFVCVGGGLRDNTGSNRIDLSVELRQTDGSGSVIVGADTSFAGWTNAPVTSGAFQFGSRPFVLPADDNGLAAPLTPGDTYFVRVMQSVSGGSSADIFNRFLTVAPVPFGTHYGEVDELTLALDRPQFVYQSSTVTQGNIATDLADFDYGSPHVSVEFVAPASGRALIGVAGGIRDNNNTGSAYMTPEVRYDSESGPLLFDPQAAIGGVDNAFRYAWSNARGAPQVAAYQYGNNINFLGAPATDPLEPGRTYFARVIQWQQGGNDTADIFNRQIFVIPLS